MCRIVESLIPKASWCFENRRERFESKADGTQEPECTSQYMRIPSTAQRSYRNVQQVFEAP